MTNDLVVLSLTAAGIGVLHTALGPDHYLPFVLMARSERWSQAKMLWVTLLCGLGHVLSSVLVGTVGIVLGVGVGRLGKFESMRGDLAAWGLIAFGLVYGVWGLRRAHRNRPHTHVHTHCDDTIHTHMHGHQREHIHLHQEQSAARRLTPWILFILFVFGPCEPLIPLLMYPAARSSVAGVVVVTAVFSISTLATMAALVKLASIGIQRLPLGQLERYTHALAGAALCLCGIAIAVFGL